MQGIEKLQGPERLKLMKKAMRAAGRVMLQVARRVYKGMVKDRSGTLRKSLKSRLRFYKKADVLVLLVGVQSWFKGEYNGQRVIAHKYAHLVTRGRKKFRQTYRYKDRKGRVWTARRWVKGTVGRDFIEVASRAAVNTATEAIRNTVAQGLQGA